MENLLNNGCEGAGPNRKKCKRVALGAEKKGRNGIIPEGSRYRPLLCLSDFYSSDFFAFFSSRIIR